MIKKLSLIAPIILTTTLASAGYVQAEGSGELYPPKFVPGPVVYINASDLSGMDEVNDYASLIRVQNLKFKLNGSELLAGMSSSSPSLTQGFFQIFNTSGIISSQERVEKPPVNWIRSDPVSDMDMSPDERYLSVATGSFIYRYMDSSGDGIYIQVENEKLETPAFRTLFAPNNRWLAFSDHNELYLSDSTNLAHRKSLQSSPGTINSLAVDPRSYWLAAGDSSGGIRVHDVTHTNIAPPYHDITEANGKAVLSLDVNPAGTLLLSGGKDNKIHLWNATAEGNFTADYKSESYGNPVHVVLFHPLNPWYAVAEGAQVHLYSLNTHELLDTLTLVNKGNILSMDFHPDGSLLAVGTDNNRIAFYLLKRLPPAPEPSSEPSNSSRSEASEVASIAIWAVAVVTVTIVAILIHDIFRKYQDKQPAGKVDL